jgi:hypothetical protein
MYNDLWRMYNDLWLATFTWARYEAEKGVNPRDFERRNKFNIVTCTFMDIVQWSLFV